MKHSIEAYRYKTIIPYGARHHANFKNEWRRASTVATITTSVFLFASLVLLMMWFPVDGESIIGDIWYKIAFALTALTQAVHWGLSYTHDTRGLTPTQTRAVWKFSQLPKEVQQELGGRENLIKSLSTLTDKDAFDVCVKMSEAKEAHEEAERAAREMSSNSGHMIETLDRFIEDRNQYKNTIKELS